MRGLGMLTKTGLNTFYIYIFPLFLLRTTLARIAKPDSSYARWWRKVVGGEGIHTYIRTLFFIGLPPRKSFFAHPPFLSCLHHQRFPDLAQENRSSNILYKHGGWGKKGSSFLRRGLSGFLSPPPANGETRRQTPLTERCRRWRRRKKGFARCGRRREG